MSPAQPDTEAGETTRTEDDDEAYNSASDSDFDPDAKPLVSAADDTEQQGGGRRKRKRGGGVTSTDAAGAEPETDSDEDKEKDETLDLGWEDEGLASGDEALISKGKERRKRKRKHKAGKKGAKDGDPESSDLDEDDEGGEGGLIKTRAQRANEQKERKPLANASGATVDVDAVWASMLGSKSNAAKLAASAEPKQNASNPQGDASQEDPTKNNLNGARVSDQGNGVPSNKSGDANSTSKDSGKSMSPNAQEEMITINRTYDFAGQTITEEKRVPKFSAEAKLYLQSQSQSPTQPASQTGKPPLRRPTKRSSMFEPNPTGTVKGLPTSNKKGPKLNTIEKSKLDWAGFVDKEGIAEDLDEHSRAKEGYMGRMDFLGRTEARREDEWKNAQKK